MPDVSQRTPYCNKEVKVKQYHKYYYINGREDEAPIRHFFPNCKPKENFSLLLKSSLPIL